MGGLVLETNVTDIVGALDAHSKMEKVAPAKITPSGPKRM